MNPFFADDVEPATLDLPALVTTPTGDEAVDPNELTDDTVAYSLGELELLLAAANPHEHPTVPDLRSVPRGD